MDKQKKEIFILLVMVLFFIAILPRVLFKKNNNILESQTLADAVSQPATPETVSSIEQQSTQGAAVIEQVDFQSELSAASKPDPFDLPVDLQEKFVIIEEAAEAKKEEEGELPGFRLSGVVWGGNMPIAFIDDKPYKIGDTISDAKILDIDRKGALFSYKDKKIWMRLKK
jgi:hypothetical protein